MEVLIREAEAKDYNEVRCIMNQVQRLHAEWRPDIYCDNENFYTETAFREELTSHTLYVAESGHRVTGVLSVFTRHVEAPTHVTRTVLFVDCMAIDERCRGNGIGRAFFQFLKDMRDEKHFDGIELQVNAKNTAAYEMYRHCGFTEKSINMELL